jgi:hypothetical protein
VVIPLLFSALLVVAAVGSDVEPPLAPPNEEPAAAAALEPSAVDAPPDESMEGEAALAAPAKRIPGIRKLDRPRRAIALAALAGFIILWIGLIVLIWLGARYTRRYMHASPRALPPGQHVPDPDDWARKKLIPETDDEG